MMSLSLDQMAAAVFGSLAALTVGFGWLAVRKIDTVNKGKHAAGGSPLPAAGGVSRPAAAFPPAAEPAGPAHSSARRGRQDAEGATNPSITGPARAADDESGLDDEDTQTLAVFREIKAELADGGDRDDDTLTDLPAIHIEEAAETAELLERARRVLGAQA